MTTINALGNDPLRHTVSFLPMIDLVHASGCSRRFNEICKSDQLWRPIMEKLSLTVSRFAPTPYLAVKRFYERLNAFCYVNMGPLPKDNLGTRFGKFFSVIVKKTDFNRNIDRLNAMPPQTRSMLCTQINNEPEVVLFISQSGPVNPASVEMMHQQLLYTSRTKMAMTLVKGDPELQGKTLVDLAAKNETELVKELLQNGTPVPLNYRGWALYIAAENNNFEVVRMLLEGNPEISADYFNLALRKASQNNHWEMVELLLTNKYPINYLEYYSLLVGASTNGKLEIVKQLLKNPIAVSKSGLEVCIEQATKNGHLEIVALLRADNAG